MKLWKNAYLILVSLLYWACSESGVDAEERNPSGKGYFFLAPNVHQLSDSIDDRIGKEGVRTRLSPGGKYTLVAFNDSLDVEPVLFVDSIKCCEGGCSGHREGNRLLFYFSCELSEPAYAILQLKDACGNFLEYSFYDVSLVGEGDYSDHLSLNLIIAGAFDSTSDGKTVDSLARAIGQSVHHYFDIQVDTVYISYAYEHPSVGYLFTKDSVMYVGSSLIVNSLSEPWGESGKDGAFDIVLVDYIDNIRAGYAYRFFYQNSLNLDVSIVAFRGSDGFARGSKTIQNVSVHEIGHVMGLSHTTLTMKELLAWGDYSIYEDGLEDTPYCQKYVEKYQDSLKSKGLEKRYFDIKDPLDWTLLDGTYKTDSLVVLWTGCPDYFNIMYPYEGGEYDFLESSPMQRAIVKKNLTLIPH
jgi:hypothetical protein